jgi:hypothetical protein
MNDEHKDSLFDDDNIVFPKDEEIVEEVKPKKKPKKKVEPVYTRKIFFDTAYDCEHGGDGHCIECYNKAKGI